VSEDDPPTDGARSPPRLSDEELGAIESALHDLRRSIAAGDFFEAERILQRPTLDASALRDLVNEVRRLRALVRDVAPYLDGMDAGGGDKRSRDIRQLQVRLRAEVKDSDPSRPGSGHGP
jgi:hypothetical protein